ncbi:unnamed protein product [Periconia digitata]|uniref:Uncharacterized protein n=1 Tax=Periconia digitata TaxID=1303443 RepID=A0A9W4UPA6_9PLEO|nr:unnamed protein product [Periconia digitata]
MHRESNLHNNCAAGEAGCETELDRLLEDNCHDNPPPGNCAAGEDFGEDFWEPIFDRFLDDDDCAAGEACWETGFHLLQENNRRHNSPPDNGPIREAPPAHIPSPSNDSTGEAPPIYIPADILAGLQGLQPFPPVDLRKYTCNAAVSIKCERKRKLKHKLKRLKRIHPYCACWSKEESSRSPQA